MPRYFTLQQAELLLPEVERALRDALFHRAEAQKSQAELQQVAERIRFSGGARIDPDKQALTRAHRDSSITALKTALDEIDAMGALIKDLDIGLIDFMTRYRDSDVCLCWKLGEDGIRFWHGAEEGFRGRKPIDEEFRQGHSTGAAADPMH